MGFRRRAAAPNAWPILKSLEPGQDKEVIRRPMDDIRMQMGNLQECVEDVQPNNRVVEVDRAAGCWRCLNASRDAFAQG